MALNTEEGLDLVRRIAAGDSHLAVLVTLGDDGLPQASVVNAGVHTHPTSGDPVVAAVLRGGSQKQLNLRANNHTTLVFRSGWEWVGVAGPAELIGPDDGSTLDAEQIRVLLRDVYKAAGGDHDNWDEYDRVMAEDRRVAMLVRPDRIWSN